MQEDRRKYDYEKERCVAYKNRQNELLDIKINDWNEKYIGWD